MKNIEKITVVENSTILQTIEVIDKGILGIALVVDDKFKLIGTVTDGDIRRALLKKASLNDSIKHFMSVFPIKAIEGTSSYELLSIMKSRGVDQIPIVDSLGKLIDIKTLTELIIKEEKENKLVIMAGGIGSRLKPLTHGTPKPLLPIGNKPILETIIEHAKLYGLIDITISLNYLSDSIKNHFDNGSNFGVRISYVEEKESLGTAGALSYIKNNIFNDLFVINGDILTKINFDEMLEFHKSNDNLLTVGTRPYKTQVPYGIVNISNNEIKSIEEKPVLEYTINAGIYLISPKALQFIPSNKTFHMTDLMQILIDKKLKVGSFIIKDYWLDIGKINDYFKANIEFNDFFL